VGGICAIYAFPFKEVKKLIEFGAREHDYLKGAFDQGGNARSSFVSDIREFKKLFEVKPLSRRGPDEIAPA
jgi:hypothetical protein